MDMGSEVRVIEVEIDSEAAMPDALQQPPVEAEFEVVLEETRRLAEED